MRRSRALPLIENREELLLLEECCKKTKTRLVIKRHPFQSRYPEEEEALSGIVFIDQKDLEQEQVALYALLHYSDGLVNDYSSVAVDYMLLHKPMAFSLEDYEEYRATRGFSVDDPLKYMPGNHLYKAEDFVQFVREVAAGEDAFRQQREELFDQMHIRSENYSRNVWDFIQEKGNE